MDLDGYVTIEIRMPPSLSEAAIQELGHSGAAQAFPAIEVIELAPPYRRLGIFTRLVLELAKSPSVRAVVISNVTNADFAKSLEAKCQEPMSGWRRYKGGYFPCFAYWKNPINEADCLIEPLKCANAVRGK